MSYGRFNTPPTSRSSTTWGRYHALAVVYSFATLTTWLVLANTPDIIGALTANTDLPKYFKSLDTPVYSALLVIVLAGSVVPFSTFDDKVRRFLQDLARIPWEVQRLTAALLARTWLPTDEFQSEIRNTLRERGFDHADMSFSCERTPQALWTRITALERYIAGWQTRRGRFASYYFANEKPIQQLREEYAGLESQARRIFPKVRASRLSDDPVRAGNNTDELAQSFVDAAERVEKTLCETASRGILTCGLTDRARRSEFERIGFMVNVTPSHFFDDMLGLYFVLFVLYAVVLTFTGRPKPWLTAIVIASIYLGAIVLAIFLKRWDWARSRNGNLPVAGGIVAALAAFGFASLMSFGFSVVSTFNVQDAWTLLTSRWWPWGFMSAVVAGLLSYLVEQEELARRRWLEAGIVAFVCGAFSPIVVFLLNDACGQSPCDAPPLQRVMITASLTGGIIGWCVPTWYRRPQIIVSEHATFKIVISVRSSADVGVGARIEVQPTKRSNPGAKPVLLPDEVENLSADDAIADAVRIARAWIESQQAPKPASIPAPLSAASS